MFTGLVQGLGQLTCLNDLQVKIQGLNHQPLSFLGHLAIGDSVAVDGICLTVESFAGGGFVAATSPETLRRTTLGLGANAGSPTLVNLEPSLRVGDKLGGHFVTGHIDGVGALVRSLATATSWELDFEVKSPGVARYIVSKGSIAINGISLTIAHCTPQGDHFQVAVIPHTYGATNLQYLQPGDPVNVEGDILGKYVEKLLQVPGSEATPIAPVPDAINAHFLTAHGYDLRGADSG
ncbi:riboflavin synthase [Prochlorothrix hollandica]|uniref:Riboflavin synthase n=1 Tax=Prochlorothrix hollandica PCC 9006 = CALU 1027 TaxID=317619 RepID=A0A0M2PPG7_PROHO|nr:riboflavin synthase [Prochlorothrix hollandica]KKI98154.1 riboflavin synthase subunit alpha [Prochlorothrix hollandica PCC 9006 = CALU 1027]